MPSSLPSLRTKRAGQYSLCREIRLSWLAFVATLIATSAVLTTYGVSAWEAIQAQDRGQAFHYALYMLIVVSMVYGSLIYFLMRRGYMLRMQEYRPASRDTLETIYERAIPPAVTILVPSYKEDPRIILQTLMSAALQEYPRRRVVLLLDDPPQPGNAAGAALLATGRSLPQQLQRTLAGPASRFRAALHGYQARSQRRAQDLNAETLRLAALYEEAADWFERQIEASPVTDHTDRFYVEEILYKPRDAHRDHARTLRERVEQGSPLFPASLTREYRRLAALFDVELSSFERKCYANLSHEPNKAMNLNSYISLAGRAWRETVTAAGRLLEEVTPAQAQWQVPDADYFVTLDADSLLTGDYTLRLVQYMEQPQNARVAVTQAPYASVPGATSEVERVAGITSDIYSLLVQNGFSYYNAGFWVGANAVLRKRALEDVRSTKEERGHRIDLYIQDRTVIEDTESTIELLARGWTVWSCPQRLAFSATPPDFGSLIIQRRRWSNGGLLILPNLLRYFARQPKTLEKLSAALIRFHYLAGTPIMCASFLLILFFPFHGIGENVLVPLASLPYLLVFAHDLQRQGHRARDIARIYALNLLLMPVVLAGVLKSIQQAITGKKIPFGRTPKVQGRVAASPLYILASFGMLLLWAVLAWANHVKGHQIFSTFALLNFAFQLYAIRIFIGFGEAKEDLLLGLRKRPAPQPGEALELRTPHMESLSASDQQNASVLASADAVR